MTRGVARLVQLYGGLLRAELQAASAYRAQLLLSVFSWVAPLAFLALWRNAASAEPVGGIEPGQFTTYFCVLLVTVNLQLSMPVVFSFGYLVYEGQLSAMLLRPHHVMHTIVARAIGEKAYGLAPLIVAVPFVLALAGGAVEASGGAMLMAAAMVVLGTIALSYLAAMAGCIAFWMTKAQGVQGLLVGAEWVLGGIVAPVVLLPGMLPTLARHQPLWYADGAAPEIISGISRPGVGLLLEAAVWIGVLHVAFQWLWRRGMRQYEAVGT